MRDSGGRIAGLALVLVAGLAMAVRAENRLSHLSRLTVARFQFAGNTVFSNTELAQVVASYTGREISSEELETARRKLTEHYVSRGYINSGAVLPAQEIREGVVTVRIVEGQLTNIKVTGNRWLRADPLRDRIAHRAGAPLNVGTLRDGLQLLRQDPNVEQINADLQPGALPGESELAVRVHDRQPFWAALQVDNHRPTSVGAEQLVLLAGDRNLTGHRDALEVNYGVAHVGHGRIEFGQPGDFSGSYTVPLTVHETTLRVYGSRNDYAVIEEPFDALDITGNSYRIGVSLRQPLYRTPNRELSLAVAFERRESQTYLLGVPFSLETGAMDGNVRISALRFVQEWVDRSPNQVLALRSTFSVGVDAFGVTDNGTGYDARFWSWLGQMQYVHRLGQTPHQVILRTDVQWTDQPLLSLEQFTLGGANTVRGYRENQIVRDRGVCSGIELRLPVLFTKTGAPIVQLAPFFDFGAGWNVAGGTPSPKTISSAGIGVLFNPVKYVQAQLYWGYAFQHLTPAEHHLQDDGIHFSVRVTAF
jgi:hemolysin activation/secretion protein